MIYFEMQLDGHVRVYEMSDRLLLLRVALDTKAAALPVPSGIEEAHEYLRACCHELEMFETSDHAEAWAESYNGFRAAEVRKQLARYLARRAEFSGPFALVA
jgi:hypothetical protein